MGRDGVMRKLRRMDGVTAEGGRHSLWWASLGRRRTPFGNRAGPWHRKEEVKEGWQEGASIL